MRKILIIDDEKINLLTIKAGIESLIPNCTGLTSISAKEGIQLAKTIQPDCILMDVFMPEMDGYEACEILKKSPETKNIPVILLSGVKKDTQSRIKALNIGADAFISKPFDLEELVALINVMFRMKDAEEKLSQQLRETKTKFGEVVDLQNHAVIIYDVENNGQDFIIAEFNSAAEHLEKVKRNDVIGINVVDAFPMAKEFGIIDIFKTVFKTGEPAHSPITYYLGDGTQGWRENYVYKISSGQIVAVYSDVTEKKKADEILKQSEIKYRTLADYNFAWEYWKNVDGAFNYVSPACLRISGHNAAEFINNPELMSEITHPEYKERVIQHIDEENKEVDSYEFEFKIIRPDGTERWISHHCRPIISDENVFLGRRGINRDVTEYKIAHESLIRLNKAIESSKDVVFMTDVKNIFTYVNPQFTELYGYSSDEVIGKFTPKILNSGFAKDEKDQELVSKLLKKQSVNLEYLNKCKNGKLVEIDALVSPILDDDSEITGYLSIQHDISERKRSRRAQKVILSISNTANKTSDLKELFKFIQTEMGQIIDTTECFIALYDSETDTITLPFITGKEEGFGLESFPVGKTFTNWVIKNKKPLLATPKLQEELINKGEIEMIGLPAAVWVGVPLKTEGKVIGVFVVQNYENPNAYTQDDVDLIQIISYHISYPIERIHKEQRLISALDKATEADHLKSAFLATMSHELRTPLNAIIGFSDLIDQDTSMQEVLSHCQRINNSGHHLLTLINRMFELSMIEADKIRLQTNRINLEEVMQNAYSIMQIEQVHLNKKKLTLKLHLDNQNGELWIFTDEGKLKQILINIIHNALKFTAIGGVEFGYEKGVYDEKPMLQFYVKDTGIGIPEDKKHIVFDEFRQADDSHTREYGGMGIGLTICKKLVRFLGGDIWFESTLGKGTTFYFTIPFDEA